MIHEIRYDNDLLAIVVSHRFAEAGVHFFTPNEYSQQLAFMKHPAGHVIPPHVHNRVPREVLFTQEVLFIRSGRVRVDFYSRARAYVRSLVLEKGDTILLVSGGHGFEVLEAIEMIEVKQGPYVGEQDKTRFDPVGCMNTRTGGFS